MVHLQKPRLWRLLSLVALAFAVVALAACGGGSNDNGGSASNGPKPTLTIGVSGGPGSLNPATEANDFGSVITREIADETLLRIDQDGTVKPALAESFGFVGSGNTTFELRLRRDARFSDGAPVDAAAVTTWLEYFPKGRGSNVAWLGLVRSIEAVDRYTVRITLAAPNPALPLVLTEYSNWGFVQSPRAVARPNLLGARTYGAGPYTLDAAQSAPGDHYTFVPNTYYYDRAAIRYSKITVKVIRDNSSMLAAAQTGQVDVAQGTPPTGEAAEKAGLNVVRAPQSNALFVFTDPTGAIVRPFGDVRVRQALNYAIDRRALTQAVLGKYGEASSEPLSSDGFDPAYQDHYTYDPAKARALLAAAGYPDGFEINMLGLNVGFGGQLTQAVAADLTKVGIKVRTSLPADIGEYITQVLSGRFPVIEIPVTGRPMSLLYESFLTKEGNIWNPIRYTDPEIDNLYNRARTLDPEAAAPVWQELSRVITDKARFMPVFNFDSMVYVSDKVDGVEIGARGWVPNPTTWSPREG